MNKKAIIVIVVALLVLVVVGSILLITKDKKDNKTTNKKDGKEAITEADLIKDETFEGLKFTNTTLVKEDGQYTLAIDVTNPTETDINLEQVNIVLKDKNGNEVISLLGYIGDPMKPNETRTITSFVDADLGNVTSKTIEATK